MIRSMTGYGEAEAPTPQGQLRVAIKTVNHRFLNTHIRTPGGYDAQEAAIQGWLKAFFSRGHVNFSLTLDRDRSGGEEALPELDLERARHYKTHLDALSRELGLGEVTLPSLLRCNDLFRVPEGGGREAGVDAELLKALTEEAAGAALRMREEEGARLEEDLQERLRKMEEEMAHIEARAPERLTSERERLREAIRELSEQEDVDDERMARELAYVAERWDINEEIVRFKAHILAFRDTLAGEPKEGVGKRLGFLVQEMHREANTISSKANDVEIGHASVAIREEIERLREQLENVE